MARSLTALLLWSNPYMCISSGVGLTLGWKLKQFEGKDIPSQFATSLAFAKGLERATMRILRSTSFYMKRMREAITS